MQGSGNTKGGKAGLVPQAVSAVLANLAVVPKSRYMLTATYAGARRWAAKPCVLRVQLRCTNLLPCPQRLLLQCAVRVYANCWMQQGTFDSHRGKTRVHAKTVPPALIRRTHTGLSARQDGALVDLLAPAAAPGGAPASQAKLSAIEVTSEDDVLIALRRARVLRAMAGGHRGGRSASPRTRGGGGGGAMHVMLTLRLTTRPGEADAVSQTLTFVELVSPDLKARS